jgi:phosphonopyruvate decarboxylase
LAAGAYLGGRLPVVFMQNSGFGVVVNALVSLNQIYDIPALIVVSWRGQGGRDAPEHLIMGEIMEPFLRVLRVPYAVYDPASIDAQLDSLVSTMRQTGKPAALVVSKGMLDS